MQMQDTHTTRDAERKFECTSVCHLYIFIYIYEYKYMYSKNVLVYSSERESPANAIVYIITKCGLTETTETPFTMSTFMNSDGHIGKHTHFQTVSHIIS